MARQVALRETEDLTYEERMDRMISRLGTGASEDRKRQRVGRLVGLGVLGLMGLAVYLWLRLRTRQASSGGEFMHFLTDFM